MIEQLDILTRIVATGAGLMLIALTVEGRIAIKLKVPLVGLVVGAIGYLINSAPALSPSGWVDWPLDLISLSPPFWTWLFARRLVEREPGRRTIALVLSALVLSWLIANIAWSAWQVGFYASHLIALGLIADTLRIALGERGDDLVEKRRLIRLVLPLLVAAQAAAIIIYEILLGTSGVIHVVQLIAAVLIVVLMVFAGVALFRADEELLAAPLPLPLAEPERAPPLADLSPSERVLHDRLAAAMADGAWREPGLTIPALAAQLDTPEHRLRTLINQRMGYRNFSAFLNRYRIAEARAMLASADAVDLPVLTIAMDLGYNSLPPFNRAFRAETGTSPSEYRRQAFEREDDGQD